jgi:hypothetical protein
MATIRCEIELDVTGSVRLVRLPGCTLADDGSCVGSWRMVTRW